MDNDSRIIWLYLIDNCSIAGIWKKDIRGLNFNCNTNITEDELVKLSAGRLIDCGKFFFIPSFIKFQYPNGLGSNKPMILAVKKELSEHNLTDIIKERYGNDYLIIKVMVKEKVMVMEEGKGKEVKEKKEAKKNEAEAAEIIRYLNDIAGKSFKTDNKAFVAAIQARLVESTAERLREVIELKTVQWKEDAKMEKYLIPSTLFSKSNFWKYLGEVDDAKARGLTKDQIKGAKKGINEGLAEGVEAIYRARVERERSDNLRAANAQEG